MEGGRRGGRGGGEGSCGGVWGMGSGLGSGGLRKTTSFFMVVLVVGKVSVGRESSVNKDVFFCTLILR